MWLCEMKIALVFTNLECFHPDIMKFTVHQTKIIVLCTVNSQVFGEINNPGNVIKKLY